MNRIKINPTHFRDSYKPQGQRKKFPTMLRISCKFFTLPKLVTGHYGLRLSPLGFTGFCTLLQSNFT